MKIRLEEDELAGELLAALREHGCIAYYESSSGAIEAIAPHLFGKDEGNLIRTLIEDWQREHAGVTMEIEE